MVCITKYPFFAVLLLSQLSWSTDAGLEGYVVVGSDAGLSNRLRALVAYMHVAEWKYNAELLFVWDVNAACPGHFLEIFQPIPGVNFISNSSRAIFDTGAIKVFGNTRYTFELIMMEHDVPKNRRGYKSWWNIMLDGYGKLSPLPDIAIEVRRFVTQYRYSSNSSWHASNSSWHASNSHLY